MEVAVDERFRPADPDGQVDAINGYDRESSMQIGKHAADLPGSPRSPRQDGEEVDAVDAVHHHVAIVDCIDP